MNINIKSFIAKPRQFFITFSIIWIVVATILSFSMEIIDYRDSELSQLAQYAKIGIVLDPIQPVTQTLSEIMKL